MNEAAQFVAAARTLLRRRQPDGAMVGAKWLHQGRSVSMVDCIGIIAVAARLCRFAFRDQQFYSREPRHGLLEAGLRERFGEALPVESAQPGDVALIRWGKAEPSHVGIVGDGPRGTLTLLHVDLLRGVVEQSLRDHVLASVIEVYRPKWVRLVD